MDRLVLITGGAGFIGSHLADELIEAGYRVRVLDNLCRQVHGPGHRRPEYLHREARLIVGDVCDRKVLRQALRGVDSVVHLAAMVGVGQSMYQIRKYVKVNNQGTAVLLEELIENPVDRLIVASSMSIYGEGLYQRPDGTIANAVERGLDQLRRGEWEARDEQGQVLAPMPTPESKPPSLASVYALSKYDQERMCLMIGQAYRIPTVAMRFFNVFGPRQSLANPYTGVLAIFAARLLNRNRPLIYEDGQQRRDFVYVRDIARACRLALQAPKAPGRVFNVGSGSHISIAELSRRLGQVLDRSDLDPQITRQYRVGDIRHCFADISLAQQVLGYKPKYSLETGMVELARWLSTQSAEDRAEKANAELRTRGLTL